MGFQLQCCLTRERRKAGLRMGGRGLSPAIRNPIAWGSGGPSVPRRGAGLAPTGGKGDCKRKARPGLEPLEPTASGRKASASAWTVCDSHDMRVSAHGALALAASPHPTDGHAPP